MSEPRMERVREVLDLAMGRPAAERAAFVAGAAGSDERLRTEVMSLLSALEGAGDSLEPPLAEMAEPEESEPLTGLSFGAYVVGERIGAGGMGVVYAARDTRLSRTVAVKALPGGLARDPHRRARLELEARLLASLNHPNIASIHGVEDTARGPVMVMEHILGPTLAEEIAERRLSVEETVGIARQIARGLEAAHGAGIVHRDLKPANIKITPEGVVKVLDLGVAKVFPGPGRGLESGGVQVPMLGVTAPGLIVGTAAYMSPEQARGRAVDRRTDLWAFGCVLYEMLTGKRAFDGDTDSDAAAAVLRSEPDWSRLPPETPAGVRRLLTRCIQKDVEKRVRDAGDAALELELEAEAPAEESARRGRRRFALAAGATVLLGAGWLAGTWVGARGEWRQGWAARGPGEVRFSITTPALVGQQPGGSVAVSPDGRTLVYSANDGKGSFCLYSRRMDESKVAVIPDTERALSPFFSPDGRWVGYIDFTSQGRVSLRRVALEGGASTTIHGEPAFGSSWGDDGSIVFSDRAGAMWKVPADGGVPSLLKAAPDTALEIFGQPHVMPGSGDVLFTRWLRDGAKFRPRIEAVNVRTGVRRVVLEDASQARYAPSLGLLMFYRGGSVMAAGFDAEAMHVTGEPALVAGPLSDDRAGRLPAYAVADNGVLAVVPGSEFMENTDLAWFGVDGNVLTVYEGAVGIRTLRLSPDGSRVAFTTMPPETDMWMLDLTRGTRVRLQSDGECHFPVWTPDGTRVAYEHVWPGRESRIKWMAADGSSLPEVVYEDPSARPVIPTGFSPDGGELLVSVSTGGTEDESDVVVVRMDAERSGRALMPTPADRVAARFSPDGSMVAFCSRETGQPEIVLMPYPALDRKVTVSMEGGERPVWSDNGKRLFYLWEDRIYAAEVMPPPTLAVGMPVELLRGVPSIRYDAVGDGSQFLFPRPRGRWEPQTRIDVIIGWDRSHERHSPPASR